MKTCNLLFALFASLLFLVGVARAEAQEPPPSFDVSYAWSSSGDQYVLTSWRVPEFRLSDNLFGTVVAGYSVANSRPVTGVGLLYEFTRRPATLFVGADLLFPQNTRPDVAFKAGLQIRF
ncbi:hypothetical protein [Microcystis phage Mvi-JY20]|uniref:Uncharacterized protein n=1 Tax=Microcystis phage Mvi-JY20 TaxID=3128146 RepID=A0AAX4QH98_9CAUD